MGSVTLLDGPNFSGRTTLVREALRQEKLRSGGAVAYIGPDVGSSFSGLAPTMAAEMKLVDLGPGRQAVEDLSVRSLWDRRLATLSGGEGVLCSIAAGVAIRPRAMALDCALEQLDAGRRQRALSMLEERYPGEVLIVDNRFREWRRSADLVRKVSDHGAVPKTFGAIQGDSDVPLSSNAKAKLVISNVRHRYGRGPWVLDDVNLTLPAGSIMHLSGENGAGKSTLAKLLVGVFRPSAGSIACQGFDGGPWRRPGQLAAYSFQDPDSQLLKSRILNELMAGAHTRGRGRQAAMELVLAVAQVFGINELLETHPHELPFSMRKRVALAATFACGAPWVILDEPTLGQDDTTVAQLVCFLRKVTARGVGLIIISHSLTFAEQLPGERYTLRQGKLWRDRGGT